MAEKDIEMRRKTATGYDTYYPRTRRANITDLPDLTTPGGTEPGRLAVTDGDGAVGLARAVRSKIATDPPTETDDETQGYSVGSMWFTSNVVDGRLNVRAYVCLDASKGQAVWVDYAEYMAVDDTSGSPGPKILVGGTMHAGFFGEVPAGELMNGGDLCAAIGLSQGNLQHANEPYLKFAYQGKILFVNKKPIRNAVSWDAIAAAGAVYGDGGSQGNAQVTIGGLTYKVRLFRGSTKDPHTADADAWGSEWNRLMLPIHVNAPSSWAYPQYVNSPTEDWGVNYSDADLLTHNTHGDGSFSWCQETQAGTASHRVLRGGSGVSYLSSTASSHTASGRGARFVLELIQ